MTADLVFSATYIYIGCKECGKLLIDPQGVSQIYNRLASWDSKVNIKKTTFFNSKAYIPNQVLPSPWEGVFSSRKGFCLYKPNDSDSEKNFKYGSFKITFEIGGKVKIEKKEHDCCEDRSIFLGWYKREESH